MKKPWKPKKGRCKMVLRGDIGMEESCNMTMCALVRRFTYRAMRRKGIIGWVANTWSPLLGYTPKSMILTWGWYCFIFKTPKDSMKVLQDTWVLNGGSLMLKRWRVGFDPASKYF